MISNARILTSILACCLLFVGCGQAPIDDAGTNLSEVEAMSLADQYHLAGERYEQLNELAGETQMDIYDGVWKDSSTSTDYLPGRGGSLGHAPSGATNDNSYYFTVTRWYEPEDDTEEIVYRTAGSWNERGWEVTQQDSQVSDRTRFLGMTPEGYLFTVEEESYGTVLRFTARSRVYWGDRFDLLKAIRERSDIEDEAGETWDTTDRDENGNGHRQPGEYRDFPAWDTL